MGKMKIHEIAKKLNLTSKEVLERAKELGAEVKNHMSSVEDELIQRIETSFLKKKVTEKEEKKVKKEKNETPVIIRREVIVSEENQVKKEETRKEKTPKKEVGFVERDEKKDFNIVYRNKPAKPLTVSELFGLKEKKEEAPKIEDVITTEKQESPKEKVLEEKTQKSESETMVEIEEKVQKTETKEIAEKENNQNTVKTTNSASQNNYNNRNNSNNMGYHNRDNSTRNNNYQNDQNGNYNNGRNNYNNNSQSNGQNNNYNNTRNNNYHNNQNGNYNNGRNNYNNNGQGNGQNNNYSNTRNNNYHNNQNGNYNNGRNNYNNNGQGNGQNNNYNNTRNNNYHNNQNGNYNNGRNNYNNNSQGNGQNSNYNNTRNNNYGGNRNNNSQNFGRRPLDEKGIEKNIKNIMSSDVVEKEVVREYNKTIDKQKQNRMDESKNKKTTKQRKTSNFEINEDKLKSLKQTDRLSNMFNEQDGGMLDYYDLTTQRGRKNKKRARVTEERTKQKIFKLTEVTIPDPVTVKDFAIELKKTSGEVIKKLLNYGVLATINNEIDFDTAFLIAGEFGIVATKKETVTEEEILFDETEDNVDELQARPPVVVVMGHVDHGKTSLLDAVRKTNVIGGEAGGITQHIGAYKVKVNGREITFLDTPGHEAFTSMRARGAQVTDIAILVVAANDGVMPQTIEAINHAKAAEIPIIVAVNKMDLEGANIERVKQELMKYELVPEEWGGDTIFVPISAKQGTNIDTLLEMVLLVADMKELKANPSKQAKGAVIEAKLDKARGPVATMLVQRGTLDIGDTIVVGSVIGRIRAMTNDKGQKVKKAGPSTPVEIIGLTEVPEAGETFYEVKDEKTAKHLIDRRKRQQREKSINATARVTLTDLFSQIEKGSLKQLNLIVKADVQGSVEAVQQSLEKLTNEEVEVKVIHAATGGVTESDVTLAKVSNAIIIAFNVRPDPIARDIASKEEVEIKQYSIIYQAIEDVEAAMKGLLDPIFEEKVIGTAEIRQTFKVSNVGTIAGAYVKDGKIARNAGIRVIRDNIVIHDGKLISLKRFKDDAKEVQKGFECGLQIENYNDLQENDMLEVYVMEEVKR